MQTAALEASHRCMTDGELARRIAAGDEDAFHLVMRRHNQKLFRTARSVLKDDADAEDALQEAWLLAHGAMAGFRGEAKLSTWLTRIVVNESIARLRKRNRGAEIVRLDGDSVAVDGGEDPEAASGAMRDDRSEPPEARAGRAEIRRLLERKIDELPDAFRAVFMLRTVEELTAEETAAALGIPDATVRTRYFRARGLLRESLAREIDFAMQDAFSFDGARCDRIVAGVLARVRASRAQGR